MAETGHVSLKQECRNANEAEVDQVPTKRNLAKVLTQVLKVRSNPISEMSLQTSR